MFFFLFSWKNFDFTNDIIDVDMENRQVSFTFKIFSLWALNLVRSNRKKRAD